MLLRISAPLKWRVSRGRSLRAEAKAVGFMGVVSEDILGCCVGFEFDLVWFGWFVVLVAVWRFLLVLKFLGSSRLRG